MQIGSLVGVYRVDGSKHLDHNEGGTGPIVNENFPFLLHTNGKLNACFWRQDSSDLI